MGQLLKHLFFLFADLAIKSRSEELPALTMENWNYLLINCNKAYIFKKKKKILRQHLLKKINTEIPGKFVDYIDYDLPIFKIGSFFLYRIQHLQNITSFTIVCHFFLSVHEDSVRKLK